MEQKFKVGDVVVLKSGGSKMTVAEYGQDGFVVCEWFINKDTEVKSHKFNQDQLEIYKYTPSTTFHAVYPKKHHY